MYSVIPFLSYYTISLAADNSSVVANDIMKQLELLWTHCRQNGTRLLVHGYDASKKAVWANRVNGASPYLELVVGLVLDGSRGYLGVGDSKFPVEATNISSAAVDPAERRRSPSCRY
jgi:hypothetical protein